MDERMSARLARAVVALAVTMQCATSAPAQSLGTPAPADQLPPAPIAGTPNAPPSEPLPGYVCPECQAAAQAAAPGAAKPPVGRVTCCHCQRIEWSKYPETIHPMPRPGVFPIPPTQGPAFFSLADDWYGECREAPPKSGYAPFAINAWPFFDADWRFVDSIPWEDRTCVERLKRIPLNDCWLFSTGGEYWSRYHHEHNSRLTEARNTFNLQHVRLYGDLWYSDWLRFYGEYVWADSFGEDLPATPIDVDRGDILDLFVDMKLFEYDAKPVYVRAGRQELLYGSQRLITPLPWGNKRHTFQGVKVFRQGEKWDFDAFWTQFVPANPSSFDNADENQDFAGSWLTYKPKKGETVDFYYLLYDNQNNITQQNIVRAPFQTHTLGTRWAGDNNGFLWDFEGALQFGEQNNNDIFAGMASAGVGRSWKDNCLTPTVWLCYDYASGDSDPNSGDVNTFNQQFPFGHYYLGWMDMVGRQNIHDVNAHLYVYPTPWMTCWVQYHHFWLDQSTDALYNPGGVAYRRDATGAAGTNVGDEINFVVNFHLTRYSDILASYNKLFGGSFLDNTAGPNRASDAEALYLMFQQRW